MINFLSPFEVTLLSHKLGSFHNYKLHLSTIQMHTTELKGQV